MKNEILTGDPEFDWDTYEKESIDASTHLKRIKSKDKDPDLYDAYFNSGIVYEPKDLSEDRAYKCTVDMVEDGEVFASTESGQTVYIDLNKELKAAKKLNIIGLDFSVGREVTLSVRKVNDNYYGSAVDHYLDSLKVELFMQIKEQSVAYTAIVESVNKGGYIANISGIRCFLPGSLAAANKITDFESYVGKEVKVMVDSYIPSKDIFVISYKKYLEKIMDHKIQELDLTKKYQGQVTGTSSFGVFVEWEDIYTGLLHKTEIGGFDEISNFNTGDEIEFYVKEVRDNNRLTLTFSEPVEKTLKLYEIGSEIENGRSPKFNAIVKHKKKSGVLVDVPELSSLAMVPTDNLSHSLSGLGTGDEVTVIIYEVDPIGGKIFAMLSDE